MTTVRMYCIFLCICVPNISTYSVDSSPFKYYYGREYEYEKQVFDLCLLLLIVDRGDESSHGLCWM